MHLVGRDFLEGLTGPHMTEAGPATNDPHQQTGSVNQTHGEGGSSLASRWCFDWHVSWVSWTIHNEPELLWNSHVGLVRVGWLVSVGGSEQGDDTSYVHRFCVFPSDVEKMWSAGLCECLYGANQPTEYWQTYKNTPSNRPPRDSVVIAQIEAASISASSPC